MTVFDAVQGDLKRLPAELAGSGMAASALVLAVELDDPENSATSKSLCARALLETMDRLRVLAPPTVERDGLDDLSARRAARIGGYAGT